MSKQENKRGGCCLPGCFGCFFGFGLLLVCILGAVGLGASYLATTGPDPFVEDYEADEAQAQAYEDAFSQAVQQARGQNFTLQFNEDEFASWLNLEFKEELAKAFGLEDYTENLEFQADFVDGEVKIFAGVTLWEQGGLHLNNLAVMTIAPASNDADPDQKLEITVKEFNVGPFDATDSLRADMNDAVNDAMLDLLQPIQNRDGVDYRITNVSIDNNLGQITFLGEVYDVPIQ